MKYLHVLAGLACGLAVALTPVVAAGAPPAPTWTALAPVPSVGAGVEGMQGGLIHNKIYAAYGSDVGSGGDTDLLRVYDIATNSWSFGPNGPPPVRAEGTAVTTGDRLYAIGGRSGPVSGVVIPNNDSFDPATGTWTSLTPMPTARAGLASAVVRVHGRTLIYAIGGRLGGGGLCTGGPFTLTTVERYSVATDTWSPSTPLPVPLSDAAAVGFHDKIYVFGGCTGFPVLTFNSTVYVFDVSSSTWSTAAPMPTARAAFYEVAKVRRAVYVIGGWAGGPPLATNEVYDLGQDTWSTSVPMPTARAEMAVVNDRTSIYTVGGGLPGFGASSNAHEVFVP